MKLKYAFFLPPQVMKSKKLTALEKLIVATLMTANQDLSLTELSEYFMEDYTTIEAAVLEMVKQKKLVIKDQGIGLADPFVMVCANKAIKVKKDITEDKTNFDKVKTAFLKVFAEFKATATDKKAMGQLSTLAHASAPAEFWERYFSAIKNDEFHQETKYKHVTFEYVTRPQTIERFWKFTNVQPQQPQQRKPLTLT
jgi:hypothetical protein